jgi:hypothetical protein
MKPETLREMLELRDELKTDISRLRISLQTAEHQISAALFDEQMTEFLKVDWDKLERRFCR